MEECRLKLVYIHESCNEKTLLEVGLVAAFALIVSNNIRRGVCVRAVTPLPRDCKDLYEIIFHGSTVKGLAPLESMIEGVLGALLEKGSWPGISIRQVSSMDYLEDVSECYDGVAYAYSLGSIGCPKCILVRESGLPGRSGFKPWWLVSSIMVVYDEKCGCM